ncbi:run domain Beclin-1-interacting and cysteine-rich domain-containing protein [Ceratitis capitata]|uniref:run domain Beclin-1-interacting and cysteine-rich domain-containing protein n=1 Tax=Ceratitis capitata TaxID=7213 RepID=UPI000329E7A8|nr:run domain Beclin-1-interacting and cysteine-rich domain-containing protein [Ceratitis capitata]
MSIRSVKNSNAETNLAGLLANLKKACGLWFLNEQSANEKLKCEKFRFSSYENIITTTVEILRHGLCIKLEDTMTDNIPIGSILHNGAEGFIKLVDDFEWVCRLAQIRDSCATDFSKKPSPDEYITETNFTSTAGVDKEHYAIESFLRSWVQRNLQSKYLSVCLQVLVEEKELINAYYSENSFLRNEAYSTSLFICLSAVELNQHSLLSQIDPKLYNPRPIIGEFPANSGNKHRRTTSHPIFSICPSTNSTANKTDEKCLENKLENKRAKDNISELTRTQKLSTNSIPNLQFTFRKTKSLPALQYKPYVSFELFFNERQRPRSKTVAITSNHSLQKDIAPSLTTSNTPTLESDKAITPKSSDGSSTYYSDFNANSHTTTTSGSTFTDRDSVDLEPTSAFPQNPAKLQATSASSIASSSTTMAHRIELIKCDDIKIWTDQAYERAQKDTEVPITHPCTIPKNLEPLKQKAKSASPIGSFLCNLFSTPPTYTHWSISHQDDKSYADDTAVAAAATAFPCNIKQHEDIPTISTGGVFDAFMPVCGKKLRSRHSQCLFEDGISTLDYKTSANDSSSVITGENGAKLLETPKSLPKSQQSLTDFLQTSQMSRNNTDLEKENAHFLVSEAIISAIEHIKWDKSTEPDKKWRRYKRKEASQSTTAITATDCLATDSAHSSKPVSEYTREDEASEHIPYAELEENCLDSLSAEVVGLSLISKFNDKHLPKVSELKWLVSEEDTPQQLLPMPDNSPTSNPDENVIRPITRGTRYWAPPRQQIIFTDHPLTSRKEMIQKQNNRCAGCGMRVSRQYINSFRYCTYLGKYLCTGCHRNQMSPIPAKILQSWDFKCYSVSVFAYRLLDQMYTYPLFYVPDLNPVLYIENKSLLLARKKRQHLKFVRDFVKTCRFAVREQVYFDGIPEHIASDPDVWSLSDFIDANNKSMQHSIDQLIEKCEQHIFSCVLCTARGFVCEYCQKDQVIYPWQQKVFRCDRCGVCFHMSCWKLMFNTCCRCQRISKRQEVAIA